MAALRRPVLVLAVTLVAAWAGARVAAGSSHAAAPVRTSTGIAGCGYERWPVKTLADRGGRAVDLTRRLTSAIFRLDRLRVARGGQTTRAGAERHVYTVRAVLVAAKVEDDSDVHLELRDPAYPAATLIAELPALRCTLGARPAVRTQIARARGSFLRACGDPGSSFSALCPRHEADRHRSRLLRPGARPARSGAERLRAASGRRVAAADALPRGVEDC